MSWHVHKAKLESLCGLFAALSTKRPACQPAKELANLSASLAGFGLTSLGVDSPRVSGVEGHNLFQMVPWPTSCGVGLEVI